MDIHENFVDCLAAPVKEVVTLTDNVGESGCKISTCCPRHNKWIQKIENVAEAPEAADPDIIFSAPRSDTCP